MIRTTLGELLRDENLHESSANVYVVRDRQTVFYVGRTTRGIAHRLLEHCGLSRLRPIPDILGATIAANAPSSARWQIELWEYADYEPLVNEQFPKVVRIFAEHGERALIDTLRPCLNTVYNPNPRKLPKRYRPAEEPYWVYSEIFDP